MELFLPMYLTAIPTIPDTYVEELTGLIPKPTG